MKVLMFGWEFPPHISGGLGTACQGLSNALVSEGVEVTFVVPRLTGDEVGASIQFIGANNVDLAPSEAVGIEDLVATETIHPSRPKQEGHTGEFKPQYYQSGHTERVEGFISPYNYGVQEYAIQKWNYVLADAKTMIADVSEELTSELNQAVFRRPGEKGRKFNFTGGYGPNLIEQVEQYAVVAERIAQQNDFDIIHAHDWISFPAGIAAKKASGKPLVVHVHATEFDRSGDHVNQQVFRYEYEGLHAADRVMAVSQWTRDIIIEKYKIAPSKVEVVYNGIVPKQAVATSPLAPIGSHHVTFLGRITRQKGPFYFAEAARLVLQKFPDAHFIVAGSGDLLPAMIEFVAKLKISSHFHFTGFVKGENIDRIWSVSNVYVMPSVSEPFGLTPLEAMQSGVPVIISKQSGVSEVMNNTIKVDFWDTKSLASAICSVLKYKSLGENLKKNSVKDIQRINWSDPAKQIKKTYYGLTGIN